MNSQSHLSSCSATCVHLTGVFRNPPTACFFFTNEFSISSHRPTFSSWMDTNAPITLKEQMRFYIIKSKKKKSVNHYWCSLSCKSILLFCGSSCGGFGVKRFILFLQAACVAARARVACYIFVFPLRLIKKIRKIFQQLCVYIKALKKITPQYSDSFVQYKES